MTKDLLSDYVSHGREIEFKYNGKMYSITYGSVDEEEVISFCEFYKETTEVKTIDELLAVCRNGVSVLQMWNSLNENDIWVY